jgi:hypothetical protein
VEDVELDDVLANGVAREVVALRERAAVACRADGLADGEARPVRRHVRSGETATDGNRVSVVQDALQAFTCEAPANVGW